MIDLFDIANRLEADEKFLLKYKFPVKRVDGKVDYDIRDGQVLDVAEESGRIYVSYNGEVIWVKLDEAIEINSA